MTSNTPQHDRIMVMLKKLERVEAEVGALADDVEAILDTGIEHDDLVLLLWGRKHDRTKGGTEDALTALETIGTKDPRDIMVRLTAAYGKMSLDDAREFVDDLYEIRDRYGASP